MKTDTRTELAGQREARLRRAEHLRQAVDLRAQQRGDSPAELAQVLGMSLGHLYRIRKEPERFRRLSPDRLDAISEYVGWTRLQVMVAVGWLQPAEVDQVLSVKGMLADAWRRLEQGGLANGLATPLKRIPADHRDLMARLLILAEAGLTVDQLSTLPQGTSQLAN